MMPARTAQIVRWLTIIPWSCTVIMIAFLHSIWPGSFLLLMTTAILTSGRLHFGFWSVKLLSFDEQVQGDVLTGVPQELALRAVSRSAITYAGMSAVMCILIDAGIVAIGNGLDVDRWMGGILAAAATRLALWIVGLGAVVALLPFIVLVADPETRSRLPGVRRKAK